MYDVCAMYNQKEGNGWGPPGTSFPVYASSRASIETFQGIAKRWNQDIWKEISLRIKRYLKFTNEVSLGSVFREW